MAQSKGEKRDLRTAVEPYTYDKKIKAKGEKADVTGEKRIPGVNYHKVYGGVTLPKEEN